MATGLNWYLVRTVYRIVVGDGHHAPQFDEQWRLILADDAAWAYEKATILGKMEATETSESSGRSVQWQFMHVVDICQIEEPDDGTHLYSSTEEPPDSAAYLEIMQSKAMRAADLASRMKSESVSAA